MTGRRIGYIQVSSIGQHTDRQLAGIPLDRFLIDNVSGKDTNRPKLQELLEFVREGDTVIVHSKDRLARNLDDLRHLVHLLTKQGLAVEVLHEHLTFTVDDTPMATLLLSVKGAFAEFERAVIRERQLEGIALAKQRGAYEGRKKSLSAAAVAEIRQRLSTDAAKAQLASEFGVSRETLYSSLRGEHKGHQEGDEGHAYPICWSRRDRTKRGA